VSIVGRKQDTYISPAIPVKMSVLMLQDCKSVSSSVFQRSSGGFICVDHSDWIRVLRKKAQVEQLLDGERLSLRVVFGGGIDHQLHAFYG